jgi:hypothetical protein
MSNCSSKLGNFGKAYAVLLFLSSQNLVGQQLHRQMISSQGASKVTETGHTVLQTVGQQSVTSTTVGTMIVQQGFQQYYWKQRLAETTSSRVIVTTYPNPVVGLVNFQFSDALSGTAVVSVYDIQGRLVFSKSEIAAGNLITLDLQWLVAAPYLVRITSSLFNYYAKIIKE